MTTRRGRRPTARSGSPSMCLAQTWHIPGVDLPRTPARPALPPVPGPAAGRGGSAVPQLEPGHRPPAASPPPHRAASPATSPSPRPSSASPPQARSCGTPEPPRSVTSTRTTPSGSPDRDRDRLPRSARAAVPDAVAEQLAHQQGGVIPARMPRPEHPGRERAGNPGPLRPPGHRHALPGNRPGHQRTRLPRPPAARETTRDRSRAHGDARPTRRPASSPEYAAGAARPWPSVKQPTVRTDRPAARIAVRLPASPR